MRISKAIERLEALKEKHGDLRMGNCGYYGEFYELDNDEFAFCHEEIDFEGVSNKHINKHIPTESIVEINVTDIGPEPD